jgi:hypothetical protein
MEYVYGFMVVLFVSHLRALLLLHDINERIEVVEEVWDNFLIGNLKNESWICKELDRIMGMVTFAYEPWGNSNEY